MVRVGIAGIGFMGMTHFKALGHVVGAEVTAICTRSERKLAGDWRQIRGNFGDDGGVHDLSKITRYRVLKDLIGDPQIDLLDICLPSSAHAQSSIAALEAGKHVLVEKPIALTVADADRMLAAANASGRQLMVAHVLRFWPPWHYLKQAVTSTRFGRLVTLNLRRIIALPDWSSGVADLQANGGPLIDLHIHDVDFLLYLLGKPSRLASLGESSGDCVLYVSSIYDYGDGPRVSCQSGAVAAKSRTFLHGYEACFERATISFARATEPAGVDPAAGQSCSQILTVYDDEGQVRFPQLPEIDGFVSQLQHAVDAVGNGQPSTMINADQARQALALVSLEAQAVREGRFVRVD